MKVRQYATYVAPDGIIRKTELMEADGNRFIIDNGKQVPLEKLRFYIIDEVADGQGNQVLDSNA